MPHIESKGKEKAALGAFFFILLIASYVSQAGLKFIAWQRMALNF
jgi:hypothetical protein